MGIVDLYDKSKPSISKGQTFQEAAHKDLFSLALGPRDIKNIPTVSGLLYDDSTKALAVTSEGVVVLDNSTGHCPGQAKIREVAALRANNNGISNTWAEFGVATGRSAFFLSQYLDKEGQFFLYDSFEGLPEDWQLADDKMRTGNDWACTPPKFRNSHIVVVPGWFDDTLPHEAMAGPLALIHIDCDLYSSTKIVLERLDEQIVPGTVVLFDELWGYQNWREGEYKALIEWHREFTYLARDTKYRALIEVL